MSSPNDTSLKRKSSDSEAQPRKQNMSAKRASPVNMSTSKAEDQFIRNKVEKAGLIWRGNVYTPENEMATPNSVYAEGNEVNGSVMVLGLQTSSDLDKVLNHLKEMRKLEVSVTGSS